MILVSHAIIGASVARIFSSNPLVSFIIGVATHYAADALPHSQYHLNSLMHGEIGSRKKIFSKDMVRDIFLLALDGGLGIGVPLLLFWKSGDPASLVAICAGAFGGMFPDGLQFLKWILPSKVFGIHQRFHDWIHTKNELNEKSVFAASQQILIVMATVILSGILSP